VSLENILNKIPWTMIFVAGIQFHFLTIIFPETRNYNIHVFGMSVGIISGTIILILYMTNRRRQKKMRDLESLK